jgi:hypothetical protein
MKSEVWNNVYNYCSSCVIFFIHLAAVDTLFGNGLLLTTLGRKIASYLRMIVTMNIYPPVTLRTRETVIKIKKGFAWESRSS